MLHSQSTLLEREERMLAKVLSKISGRGQKVKKAKQVESLADMEIETFPEAALAAHPHAMETERQSADEIIPAEILLYIFSFLVEGSDLMRVSRVSKLWNHLAKDEEVREYSFQ